jgi:hypothetical protein
VAILADNVANARPALDPRLALLVHILRSMPVYRDANRLDLWESAFRNAGRDMPPSRENELLDLIWDLATYNLYGAFDAAGTSAEYQRLAKDLLAAGVPAPASIQFVGW